MEMRIVEWKMEGSLKYRMNRGKRDGTRRKSARITGGRGGKGTSERESKRICYTQEKGKKIERFKLQTEFYSSLRDCSTHPPRKIMAGVRVGCSIFEFVSIRAAVCAFPLFLHLPLLCCRPSS